MGRLLLACMLLAPLVALPAVNSLPDLTRAVQTAAAGSTVEVEDGTYAPPRGITLSDIHGTPARPVMIRARNRGKAIIAGGAGFILRNCEHLVLEGFAFTNDADQQCVRLIDCRDVRVTRCTFHPVERPKPNHWEHWVTVEGAHSARNRIDHCLFEHKTHRGSPLFIRGDDEALVCSQNDRVDHNHFRDIPYANGENGHETLRTGGNDLGAAGRSSFTVIEDNLLERCSGEDEVISLKSSDNTVRRNTLVNCRGAICFRLGNRSSAEDNIILATDDAPGCGGIKLFGFGHKVSGNYFSGLTGRKHEAPFALFPGLHKSPTTQNIRDAYDDRTASAATDCSVTGNLWIDCAPLQIGLEREDEHWKFLPTGNTFTDNQVIRTRPQSKPIVIAGQVRGLMTKNNVAHDPTATGQEPWAEWFRLVREIPKTKPVRPLTAAEVGPDSP